MRILWVFFVGTCVGCGFVFRAVFAIVTGQRTSVPRLAGESLSSICERLGGAFLKAGQILSTRVDLLPSEAITALARLRDNVRPLPFSTIEGILKRANEAPSCSGALEIDCTPLASATIAQVHVGTIKSSGQRIAVKIRRPGIRQLLQTDVRHIQFFVHLVSCLPWFRRFPIAEATREVCSALLRQSDFATEAQMLDRFRRLFAGDARIAVPEVYLGCCNSDIVVMEYLEGFQPIHTFRGQPELTKTAVESGLRALYKMIFNAGLVHCDLHASNILCNKEGRVALLDFGFVSEMTDKAKQEFAEFFLSIAFHDGNAAARIVRDTAIRCHDKLDFRAFCHDMQVLIDRTAGRRAAEFQVAKFVFDLFQVQRRHGVYGSPDFTLPILSLLTYEGLIKDMYPDIDFQEEAVPFVMESLPDRRQPM